MYKCVRAYCPIYFFCLVINFKMMLLTLEVVFENEARDILVIFVLLFNHLSFDEFLC